ncbi:MAG: GC-type dockerin domain-anchored protein [Phycisphaerales bacterium]
MMHTGMYTIGLIALSTLPALAGSTPTPMGLYCSCPPTNPHGSVSVIPSIAQLDHVDGVLVRVAWEDIETSPGVYDWSLIDSQIQAAQTYGIKVSLAVVNGLVAPDWLPGLGVEMFDYIFHDSAESIPVPWDITFQTRWGQFIDDLGARYESEDTISLVYITNSSSNGFEMQLPRSPADQINWANIGYTDALYADSWKFAIDAFADAFPNHALAHEVHPVLGSDAVAQEVYDYTRLTHGDQIGVLAAWWMVHNAIDVYPGMFEILQDASYQSHSEVQVANSYTNTPERFSDNGYQGEIDLAIDSGVRYMEVWNSDLLNASLTPIMEATALRLNTPFCGRSDLNTDGTLDFFDISAFLTAFSEQDAIADFTGDALFDFFDISSFLMLYSNGCP